MPVGTSKHQRLPALSLSHGNERSARPASQQDRSMESRGRRKPDKPQEDCADAKAGPSQNGELAAASMWPIGHSFQSYDDASGKKLEPQATELSVRNCG